MTALRGRNWSAGRLLGATNEVFLLFVSEGRGDACSGGDCDIGELCGQGGVEGWDEYFGFGVSFYLF